MLLPSPVSPLLQPYLFKSHGYGSDIYSQLPFNIPRSALALEVAFLFCGSGLQLALEAALEAAFIIGAFEWSGLEAAFYFHGY